MRFVSEQRLKLVVALCGDNVPFDETPTALPTQTAGGGLPPGGGGQLPRPIEPPIGPPILPPQPPATPITPGS